MIAPIFAVAMSAAPAAGTPALAVTAELGVVSDYRFRGISLSDRDPAVQGGVTATLASGAYANIWASTIDEYASAGDPHGATVEVDLAVGWAFAAGGFDLDAGAAWYGYPGARSLSYLELPISASRTVGPATLTVGGAYVPSQSATGNQDNRYFHAGAAWEVAGTGIEVRAGHERGAFAPGGKWDWQAGVSRSLGPVTASLTYVDTDAPGVSAAAVAALSVAF